MSATPASMLQVVASGLQDRERLNASNPTVDFYRTVIMKRTRWASQWRRVEFDGLADFGRTAICTLPIQGELITRATLVIDLPDILTPQIDAINSKYDIVAPSWDWTNGIGYAICSDVQMLIGDQIIDRFDSRALEVLNEQTGSVEHWDSTDKLIFRNPSTFADTELLNSTYYPTSQENPSKLEIVFPFWWNRGPGPQALPIQALWKDKVQFKVTFRPIQQCVYTGSRINPLNPPLSANQGTGPMPNIAGCGFFYTDPSGQDIYDAGATLPSVFKGGVETSITMPTEYHFKDAYWIVEYISLEDKEAAAYRMADLEIPIEQHVPMPVVTTGGAKDVRIRMDQGGLVRDLTWVAQRVEATDYNAYFLFSKDLGPPAKPATLMGPTPLAPVQSPCTIPWWPNAQIPDWNYGDGYIRPAFVDRRSDPIWAAKMSIRGMTRFEHEGPSIFRSLLPILGCKRAPLIDRYIYRYDFGFWPTGGLAEALFLPVDAIRGYSNWDKLPTRELSLTMNQDNCGGSEWAIDTTRPPVTVTGSSFQLVDSTGIVGFLVQLIGAQPRLPDGSVDVLGNNGDGAVVLGIIDCRQIRNLQGFLGLYLRTNDQGSASLVVKTTAGYQWLAVAASGGYGQIRYGGGGYAGSAVEVGWQGGNNNQSHEAVDNINGVYTYSDATNADTYELVTQVPLFSSTSFEMLSDGLFQYLELWFSLDASTTPLVVINLEVITPAGQTTVYPLTAPITPVTIVTPIKFTIYSPVPIPVQIDDVLYVIFKIVPNANPFIINRATVRFNPFGELSTKVIIKSGAPTTIYEVLDGGGGGGRNADAGVGQFDGMQMPTTAAFVESHDQTGGTVNKYHGGDGYYGGGSGTFCGGGGGSYVSDMMMQVNTFENENSSDVSATLTPLRQIPMTQPNFNIYSWVTRYNRLRINSGRGGLMFNEAT